MLKVIFAIDIGSSSVRCCTYEWVGTQPVLHHTAVRKLRAIAPNSGKIATEKVFRAVHAMVDEALAALRESEQEFQVLAVGFASLVMNLIGVDADGKMIGDEATMSYGCNSDAISKEVREMKSELSSSAAAALYAATGAPLHPGYALAQLRVFYHHNVATAQSIERWQTIASHCLAQWTDSVHLPISYSEASWTGLLNYRTCDYEPSALALLPEECQAALPDLADYDTELPTIAEGTTYYERWPELREARLFLGLGDGAAANIGSKCTLPTRIACTVGTSAAARICLPMAIAEETTSHEMAVEPGLFCYRIDKGHVLVGGALTDGGSVVEWVTKLLNLEQGEAFDNCITDVEDLIEEELLSSRQRAKNSVTFLPFLNGERSTGFRVGATGAMIGLTRNTTPAHLFKACLEGVTLRINAVVKRLCKTIGSAETPRIIASGQALEANYLWRQMLADCTGLEVVLDEETREGTSRGVVSMLSTALGLTAKLPTQNSLVVEPINSTKVSKPRAATHAYWEREELAQESFLEAVTPLFEAQKD